MRRRQPSLRPPINRSHVLSFFLGVLCSWCLMRESPTGEPRARSTGRGLVQDEEQNSNSNNNSNLPNHIDASKIVPHAKALNDAMQPGRGYQPDETRSKTWLPEMMGSYWWLNNCHDDNKKTTVSVPEAFGIAALNMTYPKSYFSGRKGHPGGKGPTDLAYLKYIHRYAGLVRGREVTSLVEFGNGGGPFAAHWHRLYPDQFVTVEGSGAGCALAVERGVPRERVVQHDLRHPLYLGRQFDVAVCTEVVEHVEPLFAAQIVLNLVVHADVVWFSFKTAAGGNRAWINHPNERLLTLWTNLFDFYGYNIVPFHPFGVQLLGRLRRLQARE